MNGNETMQVNREDLGCVNIKADFARLTIGKEKLLAIEAEYRFSGSTQKHHVGFQRTFHPSLDFNQEKARLLEMVATYVITNKHGQQGISG